MQPALERVKNFRTAAQTAQVLYEAAKANDGGALRSILGAGPELVFSGVDGDNDPNRAQFVRKYEEMSSLPVRWR